MRSATLVGGGAPKSAWSASSSLCASGRERAIAESRGHGDPGLSELSGRAARGTKIRLDAKQPASRQRSPSSKSGYSSSAYHRRVLGEFARFAFNAAASSADKVTLINMTSTAGRLAALKRARIDAIVGGQPEPETAIAGGYGVILLNPKTDLPGLGKLDYMVQVVRAGARSRTPPSSSTICVLSSVAKIWSETTRTKPSERFLLMNSTTRMAALSIRRSPTKHGKICSRISPTPCDSNLSRSRPLASSSAYRLLCRIAPWSITRSPTVFSRANGVVQPDKPPAPGWLQAARYAAHGLRANLRAPLSHVKMWPKSCSRRSRPAC